MATHLVTGYAGSEHIKSEDQGSFNASFFGTGQFVMEAGNQLEASIIDNNTVRILDGDILMKGRHIRVNPDTYEDMIIENGTAGVNRCDLIVMEYSKVPETGIETASLKVLKGAATSGTASAPSYTDGDILTGAILNQMPLYKVLIEGVVLVDVVSLFDTIPTFQTLAEMYRAKFIKDCETHLNSLGILDTMEEINANTQDNQLAGALALKELGERTTPIGNGGTGATNVADALVNLGLDNIRTVALWNQDGDTSHFEVIKNAWESLESGKIYLANVMYGSHKIAIIQKYIYNHSYGSILIFGYDQKHIEYYELVNGAWIKHENANVDDLANYLPLSGGMMAGAIVSKIDSESASNFISARNKNRSIELLVTQNEVGLYDECRGNWILYVNPSNNLIIPKKVEIGGDLIVSNGYSYMALKNTTRECGLYLTLDGVFGLYDETNKKWILYSDKTGGSVSVTGVLYAPRMFSGGSKVLTAADFVVTGSANEATLTINLD